MRPSYEKINYALRPGKNIERKMMADVFRRLREFSPLHAYTYIGFGSVYFSDFSLFHKGLGLRSMISIEKDELNRDRFEFNLPFACIDMHYGMATDVLPTLDWERHTIVWLDYDTTLEGFVLSDLQLVCGEAQGGSVVVVTVDASSDKIAETPGERVASLKQRIGPQRVPAQVSKPVDLSDWRAAGVFRQILHNAIEETLRDRNAGVPEGEEVLYRQLFNFHYQDGAPMLTVGGVLYRADQAERLAKCAFGDFDYVRTGDDAYRIEVPSLTFREMRHLNARLPHGHSLEAPGVPEEDVTQYAGVYRFFPSFVDAEV